MFSASLELSVFAVADLLSGAHSPVREELSTVAELHQMKRRSAGILSPDLTPVSRVFFGFAVLRFRPLEIYLHK